MHEHHIVHMDLRLRRKCTENSQVQKANRNDRNFWLPLLCLCLVPKCIDLLTFSFLFFGLVLVRPKDDHLLLTVKLTVQGEETVVLGLFTVLLGCRLVFFAFLSVFLWLLWGFFGIVFLGRFGFIWFLCWCVGFLRVFGLTSKHVKHGRPPTSPLPNGS